MQQICIVVPCYNEGRRICVSSFLGFLSDTTHYLCFVNDGSTDETLEVIQSISERKPEQVRLINLVKNSGKAEAVRQGTLATMSDPEFDIIGYLDADLSTPLEEVGYLLSHFTPGVEVVIGSRVKRLGSDIRRYPMRHYLGRIFATMASVTLDMAVYDSQCGAKLFRRETAKKIFSRSFESKWFFDLELLYRFKHLDAENFNYTVLEVPLRKWHEKGDTRIKPLEFLTAPLELLKIRRNTLKEY